MKIILENITLVDKQFDKHDGKNNCNIMSSRFSTEEEKHMLMDFRKTCIHCKNYKNCLLQEVVHIRKKRINTRKKKKESFSFFMNHL